MQKSDGEEQKHGSWGVQVLVILGFGLGLAVLGWFTGEHVDEVIDTPVTATTSSSP